MMRLALIPALGLAALALAAAPVGARAGTPVELKDQPASHGAAVTLGDVFDGAPGSAAGVVIAHAAEPGLDAVLDAGAVQLMARRAGLDWANASGFHRIVVASLPGDAEPARARKAARKGRAAQALTYARNVASGEILAAEDLVWSSDAVAPADGIGDPEAAIGKAARHALRAGAAAAAHDLSSPKVIKRDDQVAVVFEDEGVSLTLQAKSMGDAAVGDAVEVVNPASKKIIEAVCTGPGQAAVGPRAEEIRAASFQPGGYARLASLR